MIFLTACLCWTHYFCRTSE